MHMFYKAHPVPAETRKAILAEVFELLALTEARPLTEAETARLRELERQHSGKDRT